MSIGTSINPTWTVQTPIGGQATGWFTTDPYSYADPDFKVSDLASKFGFDKVVEGLCGYAFLVDGTQSEIVKLWDNAEESSTVEEFFVLGAINGCLDAVSTIAISEISLRRLLGKPFYTVSNVPGMSKHFFDIIQHTSYLDEWICSHEFIAHWMNRFQNLQNRDAKTLVEYMMNIIYEKKALKS